MPTSPRRLTNLNLGKGRCIGWRRSVKMGGSKAHLWEQLPLVSSRETMWPLCPGQWGAAGAMEGAWSSSVNDPAPSCNPSRCLCPSINQRLPILPLHKGSGSTLNTVAAIYSIIFSCWLCLPRNKASRLSGIRRQRAKTATLAARNCGHSLFHLAQRHASKKKHEQRTLKICECTFSLCDNDTFRCLSAFPAFFCRDFGFYI